MTNFGIIQKLNNEKISEISQIEKVIKCVLENELDNILENELNNVTKTEIIRRKPIPVPIFKINQIQ